LIEGNGTHARHARHVLDEARRDEAKDGGRDIAKDGFTKAVCSLSGMLAAPQSIDGLHRCFSNFSDGYPKFLQQEALPPPARGISKSKNVWLNHYTSKSSQELMAKVVRGRADQGRRRNWRAGRAAPPDYSLVPDLDLFVFLLAYCAQSRSCWTKPSTLSNLILDHDHAIPPAARALVQRWCHTNGFVGRGDNADEASVNASVNLSVRAELFPTCGAAACDKIEPANELEANNPCGAVGWFTCSFCSNGYAKQAMVV